MDSKTVGETGENILKGLRAYKDDNIAGFLKSCYRCVNFACGRRFTLSMQDEDVLQQTILEMAARHTDTELSERCLPRDLERPHSPYVWQQYSRVLTSAGEEDAGRAAYAWPRIWDGGKRFWGALDSYKSQFCYPKHGTLVFLSAFANAYSVKPS